MVRFEHLEKGQEIGSLAVDLSRASLVRYAGASGDFNPIHWNERFAQSVAPTLPVIVSAFVGVSGLSPPGASATGTGLVKRVW